jgi:hypothetical protein
MQRETRTGKQSNRDGITRCPLLLTYEMVGEEQVVSASLVCRQTPRQQRPGQTWPDFLQPAEVAACWRKGGNPVDGRRQAVQSPKASTFPRITGACQV